MRRKLVVGGLALLGAVLAPTGLGGGRGATQAALPVPCPVGALGPACAAVDLVIATACSNTTPDVPTIGPLTLDVEGGAPVNCPTI